MKLPNIGDLDQILEGSVDGIYQTSISGDVLYANLTLAYTFGYSSVDEFAKAVQSGKHKIYKDLDDRSRFLKQLRKDGKVKNFECQFLRADSSSIWIRQSAQGHFDDDGKLRFITGTISDVSALKYSEESYERLFQSAQAGLYRVQNNRFVRVNRMFYEMFGFTSAEECIRYYSNHIERIYWDSEQRTEMLHEMRENGYITNQKLKFRKPNGDTLWVLANTVMFKDEQTHEEIIEGSCLDITSQVQTEERIRFQAEHDELTGLRNRNQFRLLLAEYLESEQDFVLIFVDLDNFKDLNDTLGYPIGDALLIETARRIEQSLNQDSAVFRMGSDEFAIILRPSMPISELNSFLYSLLSFINSEVEFEENVIRATASAGIVYPSQINSSDNPVQALMTAADLALYESKKSNHNQFQFYREEFSERLFFEKQLEHRIRDALRNDDFELYYQPIYDPETCKITSAEALIRWQSDDGFISPDQFIPVAEKYGSIADIDMWVLTQAFSMLQELSNRNLNTPISINLSAHHFNHNSLEQLLNKHSNNFRKFGDQLWIELTERIMLDQHNHVLQNLNKLQEFGVRFSMDDFGTGFSSLSYLTKFPINKIKIDRSFVNSMDTDKAALTIIQASVQMAEALDLVINAEGIETREQWQTMREMKLDELQGYYFSKAVDQSSFLALLEEQQAAAV